MRRDLDALQRREHDLVVVGGGIHGACAAWDAALRGLAVVLVEGEDFGSGASANSLRVIHGGLRYLQQLDLPRMRESIRERSFFLRAAPHLVRPLPFVIATHGRGRHGRAALRIALALNDLVSADRNRGLLPERWIPPGRVLSRAAAAEAAPLLPLAEAGGAALWHDAQALDSERLTLAFVRAADACGALVANHLRATAVRLADRRVSGVAAVDAMTGATIEIPARAVLLATGGGGPLAPGPLGREGRPAALATNLVVGRRLPGAAFGVRLRSARLGDPAGGGGRYLFFVPWRDSTLIGTFYRVVSGVAAAAPPGELELAGLIEEAQRACPGFALRADEVRRVHRGLLPLKAGLEPGDPDALLQHHRVVDHRRDGVHGLVSLVGVKYTTARVAAAQAVDLIGRRLGRLSPGRTARTGAGPPGRDPQGDPVRHAVESEMALTLADVVLRRTGLGDEGCPESGALEAASRTMAGMLGWDEGRRAAEVAAVRAAYAPVGCGA